MPVTFGKKRRHGCEDYNNHAAGGGVLWCYQIATRAGTCPVRLLKVIHGAWNDGGLMRDVQLQANGPIYLMDRGFYCIDYIKRWLDEKVRFIGRIKAGSLKYEILKQLSSPRKLWKGWHLQLDAIVLLGSPNHRGPRPQVRLIIATSKSGEQFIYATSENKFSVQHIIECYKKRWHIERFHRFMKDNLGLGHLYSFDAQGLEFLILTALLTAMLLFTTLDPASHPETIGLLLAALTFARKQLEVAPVWRRNILAVKRSSNRKRRSAVACVNL